MAQRYLVPELPLPGRHAIDGELAHHLGRVLRVRVGESVRLADGRGGTATAVVVAVDRRAVTLDVAPSTQAVAARPILTVAFACPRAARCDWLIEHGTEVGIAVFQPVWTRRSRPQQLRLDRWRSIARAAVGQCDRAFVPTIAEPLELPALLANPPRGARVLLDAGGQPLTGLAPSDEVLLLVGPEGGFDEAERAAIAAAEFGGFGCTPHTLRTETAAVVGAAVVMAVGDGR
ncbi:MAG: RsmE family RNA methyltransferase [Planctomycetes bacterium]|nr:RsmE family RNA methyltransferase [Planctomycetota bacterium]